MSALADPRRRYPGEPVCDDDSEHVLRAAVDALVTARSPMYHGDAEAELHALASLVAEISLNLPHAVADARDQTYTWAEIAELLGRPKRTVKRGYAAHARTRRPPIDLD
jgi:hypothetical protein